MSDVSPRVAVTVAIGATESTVLVHVPVSIADDVATTLGALGEPYSNLATRAKTEFDVPADDEHRHALQILKQAGRCTFRQRKLT